MTEFFRDLSGNVSKFKVDCPTCSGKGKVDRKKCTDCTGIGYYCEAGNFTPEERAELDAFVVSGGFPDIIIDEATV